MNEHEMTQLVDRLVMMVVSILQSEHRRRCADRVCDGANRRLLLLLAVVLQRLVFDAVFAIVRRHKTGCCE
jgi:hypothetical protein